MTLVDPVILWTDALIYLLLGLTFLASWQLKKNRQFMVQWRSIFHSTAGSISAVVLLCYVLVGVLDTLHFHPVLEQQDENNMKAHPVLEQKDENNMKAHPVLEEQSDTKQHSVEVISALDWMFSDIRDKTEKSYSAPLATHLFVKETIEVNGKQIRAYPKLEHAGSHLADIDDKTSDIIGKTMVGLVLGFIAWSVVSYLLILRAFPKRSFSQALQHINQSSDIAWKAIFITLLIIFLLVGVTVYLSYFYHVLGTDKVGQDVFYQAIKSIRTGLVIGTLTTLIMLPFALLLGIMAGYFKGWVDDVITYLYTTLNSIPGILLIAASVLMLQVYMDNNADAFTTVEQRSDARLFFLCLILGITSWTGLCRLLRGEALKIRSLDYIQAARSLGSSHFKIITQHILPNVMHLVLISIVLDFSGLVLAEAVLAYVEIGVDPTMNSWGNMINSARLEMSREPIVWWSLFAAFCFMFVLVLAANLFSDAVRDAFDPRTRGRS